VGMGLVLSLSPRTHGPKQGAIDKGQACFS